MPAPDERKTTSLYPSLDLPVWPDTLSIVKAKLKPTSAKGPIAKPHKRVGQFKTKRRRSSSASGRSTSPLSNPEYLTQMSTAEKLRTMETLWADLSRNANTYNSPAWHKDVLSEREQRVAEGKEALIPWEEAKRELHQRLQS